MAFDPNCKNIVPLYLASVRGGKIEYRRYSMQKPYARVGEGGVTFAGPPAADAPAGPLRIGLFGPGAAALASSPEVGRALGALKGRYTLVPIDSQAPWGKASNELVNLIYQGHALGIISAGRNPSHLAEQLAVKAFVPLIALSSDRSLTNVNIPWIFRLPAETPISDVLRSMLEAAERSGPNRVKLREALASSAQFDARGEPR